MGSMNLPSSSYPGLLQGLNFQDSPYPLNPFYGGVSNPNWPMAMPSSMNLAGQSFGAMTPPAMTGIQQAVQHPMFTGPITTPSVGMSAPAPAPAPAPSHRAFTGRQQGEGSR